MSQRARKARGKRAADTKALPASAEPREAMSEEQKQALMAQLPKPSQKLEVPFREGTGYLEAVARSFQDPVTKAALNSGRVLKHDSGELDLMGTIATLRASVAEVQSGDFGQADAMLVAQAYTLDAVFSECLRMFMANQFTHHGAAQEYLRVALKTQGQVRATWEAISKIHHPIGPATFVKQANIANGPQQVNNGTEGPRVGETVIPANQTIGGPHG